MIFHCYGPFGMGDAMMYLNVTHAKAHVYNHKEITLIFHWPWDENYQYHFEDPEPMHERVDYIHQFYKDKHRVKIKHIFNDDDPFLKEWKLLTDKQYITQHVEEERSLLSGKSNRSRLWPLDNLQTEAIPKKLVLWRPTFNREEPRKWKLVLNNSQWEDVIGWFRKEGYQVVELTYRTPIREALYHCRTCELACFYDGMWHMITTGLFKPTIVIGNTAIALYNTVNGIPIRTPNEIKKLQEGWYTKQRWKRVKNDGRGGLRVLGRFDLEEDLTGWEWIQKYNLKMKARLERAIHKKIDWTNLPVLVDEEARLELLDNGKNRSRSNRG